MALVKRVMVVGDDEPTPRKKKGAKSRSKPTALMVVTPKGKLTKAAKTKSKMPRKKNPATVKFAKKASKPAAKRKLSSLSIRELTMLAWEDTYAKRHKRVA